MSYYPILTAPHCHGVTTVYNYAPNNWQEGAKVEKYLNVSYANGTKWVNRCLGLVDYGDSVAVSQECIVDELECDPITTTLFLYFSSSTADPYTEFLPKSDMPITSLPAWRASLSLVCMGGASTNYQGEVDPFPTPGSLLTFGYLLQVGSAIRNVLLFINLENSPLCRRGNLELRDAKQPSVVRAVFEVFNNRVNALPLDYDGMSIGDLPLLVCREMSGIPLYFSYTEDFRSLSLEHSHPPASTVIHGSRSQAQRIMKNFWFSRIE